MLNVEQFRYGFDNLAYVVYSKKIAMIIDGGAWEDILRFLDQNELKPCFITNTHNHVDHTSGNDQLIGHIKAGILTFTDLPDNGNLSLGEDHITVMRTPGHSHDSVCFYTGSALISGDTLFNGTIGNCFTGDLKGFLMSIKRIMALPPETLIYAGHDYIQDSLTFAMHLEPDNPDIPRYLDAYNPRNICSTLVEELKINPYLRFNDPTIEKLLINRGLPHGTECERWKSMMSIA